ncbi:ribbon-helix-helix protein, CopG family [Rhodococcus ruber]|nr:ribbon-helix-helix protein, CopG family [Rhodococcus ruber]MBD8056671.1 ribbon-helix-helix protein, CopG family [Rhodococcus ruber]
MNTPLRNVRVPDELWDAARERAEAEGRHVSDVVREALHRYAKGKEG